MVAAPPVATPVPPIARVEILWSENRAVPTRTFRSLAEADAALAHAFTVAPPPSGGAYDKTAFLVVWADGRRHEGRADVREVDVASAPAAGGILRQHLDHVGRWLRDKAATTSWWSEEERVEHAAWGEDLLRRLAAEPVGVPRNLPGIPDDVLVPVGHGPPSPDVTLLPDPVAAIAALEARFAAVRPLVAVWMGGGRKVPRTTNRDIRFATNWITMALAGDLARLRDLTGRPQGAVWDRWARTVDAVKRQLGADPDAPYPDTQAFWSDHAPYLAHKLAVALHGYRRSA